MHHWSIKHIVIYFAIISLSLIFKSSAQDPYYYQDSNQPTNAVFNLFQDSKGFMWLATNKGLFKYDGFEYILYRSHNQSSVAGSDIQEDAYGRIWYENFDGFLFYVQNDKLNKLKQNAPTGFVSYGISTKYLFVVKINGIDIYDIKTLQHVKTIEIPFEQAESATVFNNNFFFIADDIIYKIDENFQLSKSEYFKESNPDIKYIYPYNNHFFYVVMKYNDFELIYFFDEQMQLVKTTKLPLLKYIQGSNIIDNEIWLHTSLGSYVYDIKEDYLSTKSYFTNSSNSEIVKDLQNNYWFSSVNNGIFIVPELNHEVYTLKNSNFQRLISTTDGYLIGTEDGLILQTDKNFSNEKVLVNNKQQIPTYYLYHNPIEKQTLYSDIGFSIISNNNPNNILQYNIALKEAVRLDEKYYAVVVSGYVGLLKIPHSDKSTKSIWDNIFYKYQDSVNQDFAKIIKGVRGKSIEYDPTTQTIYASCNIGLYKITTNLVSSLSYLNEPFNAEKIVAIDSEFYFHNTNGNLYKINKNNNFQQINGSKYMPDHSIRMIRKVDNHLLIVGVDYMYWYNITDRTIKRIDFHINANHIRDIYKEHGNLIILTKHHIIKVPINFTKKKQIVPFHINSLVVNHQKKDWTKHLSLLHHQNNVEIKFSVLNFSEKNDPVFYRINNSAWIEIHKDSRTITFPSLAAGDYLIEFKSGQNVVDEKIELSIHLPFWKIWYYYVILALIVISLFYFYFKRERILMHKQIKLLHQKVILEKNLSKSTMAAIKSQMNPHFFYNALNTIQAYIFTNDKQNANNYLAKFSKLTRLILEMSERETVSFDEEIQAITLYIELEKMRFGEQFHYQINYDKVQNIDNIELPPMLIQPYIENAIKHGLLHKKGDKVLTVDFATENNNLIITVEDNGVGRKVAGELNNIRSTKHQSFATSANEKRLTILNQGKSNKVAVLVIDKYSLEGTSMGTKVKITIPI